MRAFFLFYAELEAVLKCTLAHMLEKNLYIAHHDDYPV